MSGTIRVAHVIYRLAMGGMENGLVNLVNRMDGPFEHHIISLTDASSFQERITNPHVTVHTLNKLPGKDPRFYWRLLQLIRHIKPDIVHTRNYGTVDCGAVARAAGVSTLIHSEHGWDVSDLHGTNQKYLVLRRWMSRLAVCYLSVSKHIHQWLETDVGIKPDKLLQIYNGVDAQLFKPDEHALQTPMIVGFVGRLEQVKNPMSLLRALQRCQGNAEQERTIELHIVGNGSLEDELRTAVSDMGLDQCVQFLGARSDIPSIMPGFDVFVLPSYNEGISNTILEAMACGVPVVATDVGGNGELVEHLSTGVLYQSDDDAHLADALLHYANHEPQRRSHGRAARLRVEQNFTLESMISAYQELYFSSVKHR